MKLYDYQEKGVEFLYERRRAMLCDVPGLGKTAQAVRAAEWVGAEGMQQLDTLVVCPAVAIPVWESEWARWTATPLPSIVSYAKLARLGKLSPLEKHFDLVILDEHHYAKNPRAKRTKIALAIAQRADRAWLLSGTPMPNNPAELYTVFTALWPEHVPDGVEFYMDWMDYFCKWYTADYGPRVTGAKRTHVLRRMLGKVMLRRRIQDVNLQLPPLRLHVVPLPADRRFAEELEALIDEQEIETATVRRLLGAHKAERIARVILDEPQVPIVVMYHHRDTGRILTSALLAGGRTVAGFDGSTSTTNRADQIEAFQQGLADVFVVQQQAGGVAITLTAASEIILVEPDWCPEVNAQAIKRVHRIGSRNPVRARIFSVQGSLDEAIMETLATKIRMKTEVFSHGK